MSLIIFFLLICIFVHNHLLYVLEKKLVHYSLVAGILILLDGHNESLAALNYQVLYLFIYAGFSFSYLTESSL